MNKFNLYYVWPITVLGFTLGCLSVQFCSALPIASFTLPYLLIMGGLSTIVYSFTAVFYAKNSALIPLSKQSTQLTQSIVCKFLNTFNILNGITYKPVLVLSLNCIVAVLLGMTWAAYDGSLRISNVFPREIEGKDITVTGYVSHLPVVSLQSQQILFVIESNELDSNIYADLNGKTVSLSWYQSKFNLKPAQYYRLTFRAKQRHGSINPNGFDYEQWLVSKNIIATGYIRTIPEDLGRQVKQLLPWIERLRDRMRSHIFSITANTEAARWVSALALGDQRSLDDTQWQRYNRTGTGHLLAVSGTHIALMGALLSWLATYFWKANPSRLLWMPVQTIRLNILLISSIIYALISGWALPAQRTVLMLCVAWIAKKIMSHQSMYHIMATAACIALIQSPMAVVSASFWLSYGAVAILIAIEYKHTPNQTIQTIQNTADKTHKKDEISKQALFKWLPQLLPHVLLNYYRERLKKYTQYPSIVYNAAHTQWVLTLALIPVTALFFNQISLVSPLANAIAIPIMGWISTPLALLIVVLSVLWQYGAVLLMNGLSWVQTGMEWILEGLLALPYASIYIPSTPWFWQIFGVLSAVGCAFFNRYRLLGYIAVFLFILGSFGYRSYLSLFDSAWQVVFLDVGQGMAVVVHSQGRTLLFDTGPRYGKDSDAAERIILPYLRTVGVTHLDHVILSHADEDHSGGVDSLLTQIPIKQWWYSLAPNHPLLLKLPANRLPCQAGTVMVWAGLNIRFLHPPSIRDFSSRTSNSISCVLQISGLNDDKQQYNVLLTGDIESNQELNLINEYGQSLHSYILLSPHHGSKTSSNQYFLNQVNPQHVIIQNGYKNRYGHPHSSVVKRYMDLGITQWRSDIHGAIVVDIDPQSTQAVHIQAWRMAAKRYWHTVIFPDK